MPRLRPIAWMALTGLLGLLVVRDANGGPRCVPTSSSLARCHHMESSTLCAIAGRPSWRTLIKSITLQMGSQLSPRGAFAMGLLFIMCGLWPILVGVGWIHAPAADPTPGWVPVCAGLVFVM